MSGSGKGHGGPRCPYCNKELTDAMRDARPFCSARCRAIDLGRWLNEEYRIPSEASEGDLPPREDEGE